MHWNFVHASLTYYVMWTIQPFIIASIRLSLIVSNISLSYSRRHTVLHKYPLWPVRLCFNKTSPEVKLTYSSFEARSSPNGGILLHMFLEIERFVIYVMFTMITCFHIIHAEVVVRHLRFGYTIFHLSWNTVHLGVCLPTSYSVCREVEDVVRENVGRLVIPNLMLLRVYI